MYIIYLLWKRTLLSFHSTRICLRVYRQRVHRLLMHKRHTPHLLCVNFLISHAIVRIVSTAFIFCEFWKKLFEPFTISRAFRRCQGTSLFPNPFCCAWPVLYFISSSVKHIHFQSCHVCNNYNSYVFVGAAQHWIPKHCLMGKVNYDIVCGWNSNRMEIQTAYVKSKRCQIKSEYAAAFSITVPLVKFDIFISRNHFQNRLYLIYIREGS